MRLREFRLRFHHTWKLDPPPEKYYRFFRVSGIDQDEWNALWEAAVERRQLPHAGDLTANDAELEDIGCCAGGKPSGCLHVGALELYGDVHEVDEAE